MKTLVICGAGRHGLVVLDILLRRGWVVNGFLDDVKKGEIIYYDLPFPILGVCEKLLNYDACILAIGNNQKRAELFNLACDHGVELIKAIDPTSNISESALIGIGTTICRQAIIQTNSKIGRNVIVNSGAIVEHDNIVEDHVHIGSGAHLGGEVTLKKGSLIGTGATIMRGLTIGENSIVGAGTVIIQDVEPNTTIFERKLWETRTKLISTSAPIINR